MVVTFFRAASRFAAVGLVFLVFFDVIETEGDDLKDDLYNDFLPIEFFFLITHNCTIFR